jgi:hypothetical protein
MDHAKLLAIAIPLGVFLAHHGIAGGDLHARDINGRNTRQEAERGNAYTDSGLENGIPRLGWNRSAKKNRVNAGAIAFFRLQNLELAAQEPRNASSVNECGTPAL